MDSVVGVELQSDNGTTLIDQLQLEPGRETSHNLFGSAFVLPSTPFRILFRAVDHCGLDVLRFVPKLVKPQPIQLQGLQPAEKTRLVEPGKTVDIEFKLHNTGETNEIEVVFTDDRGYDADINIIILDLEEPQRRRRDEESVSRVTIVKKKVTLKPGQTAVVTIVVKPPEQAELGDSNTATVEVVDNTGVTLNSIELDMVVAPTVMSIPISACLCILLCFVFIYL